MSDNTALGDRMKAYEYTFRHALPRRAYTLMRIDGRAFHSYLRNSMRPFDTNFVAAMDEITAALCQEMQGTQFAYTQSDEISFLLTDFDSIQTQAYFGGVVAKLLSIPPSLASVHMYREMGERNGMLPQFDCRVWSMSDPVEVANYFVWRQRDAVRNSIQMLGQHWFSQSELNNKNVDEVQEMLFQQYGVNWSKLDSGLKNGRMVLHNHDDGGMVWAAEPAVKFEAQPDNILAVLIPVLPSLR